MKTCAINRRTALRNLLYIAGGILLSPACFRESENPAIHIKNLQITEADEHLLAAIVETIIPSSDTLGGKELLLHLFVLKMVDDCHSPDDHLAFKTGMDSFVALCQDMMGGDFAELESDKRLAFLKAIQEEGKDEEIKRFFAITKRRTIQGYLNSKYVMTNLIKYELVPGRYNGYAKI